MTKDGVIDVIAPMERIPIQYPEALQAVIEWRGAFENIEVNMMHSECFEHELFDDDWWSKVNRYSLGWLCMRRSGKLIAFANVAWDGSVHAFILDTMTTPAFRHHGLATSLIEKAVSCVKESGCEWLHVDFEPHLRHFYLDACGFKPTDAGLISLK